MRNVIFGSRGHGGCHPLVAAVVLLLGSCATSCSTVQIWRPPADAGRDMLHELALPQDLKLLPEPVVLWETAGGIRVSRVGDVLVEHGAKGSFVRGVSLKDGTELWRVAVESARHARDPLSLAATAVLQTEENLIAFRAADGKEGWRVGLSALAPGEAGGFRFSACSNRLAVTTPRVKRGPDKKQTSDLLVLREADGEVAWRTECGEWCKVLSCTPDVLMVKRNFRTLTTYSLKDGQVLAETKVGSGCCDVLHPSQIGIDVAREDDQEVVTAIDLATGKIAWQRKFDYLLGYPDVRLTGTHVLALGDEALRSLDPATGKDIWALYLSRELQDRFGRGMGWANLSGDKLFLAGQPVAEMRGVHVVISGQSGRPAVVSRGFDWPLKWFSVGANEIVLCSENGRWRRVSTNTFLPPLRSALSMEQDVADTLARLAELPENPPTPQERMMVGAEKNGALDWLLRLGFDAYRDSLLGRLDDATPVQLERFLPLLEPLPEHISTPILIETLLRLLPMADEAPAIKAANELLGRFGHRFAGQSAVRLLSDLMELSTEYGSPAVSTVRALGRSRILVRGTPTPEQLRMQRRQRAALGFLELVKEATNLVERTGDSLEVLDEVWAWVAATGPARPLCPKSTLGPAEKPLPDDPCRFPSPPRDSLFSDDGAWAVVRSMVGYRTLLWVMRNSNGQWQGPYYTGLRLPPCGRGLEIREESGVVRIRVEAPEGRVNRFHCPKESSDQPYVERIWRIDPAKLAADSDDDGWSDAVETRLGINATKEDSDDDGTADVADPSPLCAPVEPTNEKGKVLDAARRYVLGLRLDTDPIFVDRDRHGCFQVPTLGGPVIVLPTEEVERLYKGFTLLSFKEPWIAAEGGKYNPTPFGSGDRKPPDPHCRDGYCLGLGSMNKVEEEDVATADRRNLWPEAPTAKVSVTFYRGPLDASGHTVLLKKVNGKWRVIHYQGDWIS